MGLFGSKKSTTTEPDTPRTPSPMHRERETLARNSERVSGAYTAWRRASGADKARLEQDLNAAREEEQSFLRHIQTEENDWARRNGWR